MSFGASKNIFGGDLPKMEEIGLTAPAASKHMKAREISPWMLFCLCVGTSSDELMQLSLQQAGMWGEKNEKELLRRNFRQTAKTHLVYDLLLMSTSTQ